MCMGVLRFVTILFLLFEKSNKQKNVLGFFKIYKYTFLNFWERIQAIELC